MVLNINQLYFPLEGIRKCYLYFVLKEENNFGSFNLNFRNTEIN